MSKTYSTLKYQLQIAETQLTHVESRLSSTIDPDESAALVEHAVDLTTLVLELKNALDDLPVESSSSAI